MRPDKTYSIEQFIDSGKGVTLTYHNLSLINTFDKVELPYKNVFYDYLDDINSSSLIKLVELTEKEIDKYKYRPKILAYDIYGAVDLDFVILALNGIYTPKDFLLANKKIKLIGKRDLNSLLTSIYNAEKNLLDRYRK